MEKMMIDNSILNKVLELYARAEGEAVEKRYAGNVITAASQEKAAEIVKLAGKRAKGGNRIQGPINKSAILRKAAAVVLMIGITCSSVFVLSETARAAVLNWYREITGNHITYHFEGKDNGQNITIPEFEYIPEGFIKQEEYSDNDTYDTWFKGPDNMIDFGCYRIGTVDWADIITPSDNLEIIYVNGIKCDFYQTQNEEEASFLIWQDDANNVVCILGSTLNKDEIINIAEHIKF